MKKITIVLSLLLCVVLLFSFVGCSSKNTVDDDKNPTTQNNSVNSDGTMQSTNPNENKPNNKEDKNDKDDTNKKTPSKLSQETDGFYFTFNGNKIKLPMKYSDFMKKMDAIAIDTVPEKIFSHESQVIKIKVGDTEAKIVVMGNDFNKEINFADADVISLEMNFIDEIVLKKDVKNNFIRTRVIARYGEPDFGNASQYHEYLYYSLPHNTLAFESYSDHNFGLELTLSTVIDDSEKGTKNTTIEYFKYGSLNIGYVEY